MKSGPLGASTGPPSTTSQKPLRRHLGTVPVRSDLIISLREAKGWSQRTLAKHAICSQATIKSVEAGREAFSSTLEKIAKALGVNYVELMTKPVSKPLFGFTKRYVKIKFDIDIEFYNFDETDELQKRLMRIRDAIAATDGLRNLSIEEGTVAVSTEMTEADAIRFVRAFCRGRLNDEDVSQITLNDEVGCNLWRTLANRFDEVKNRKSPQEEEIKTFGEVYVKQYLKTLCADIRAKCPSTLSDRELARKVNFAAALMFEILLSQYHRATVRLEEHAGTLILNREETIGEGELVLV
jgi:transcriptional regulator with XRE-family HTH domain